MDVKGKKVAEAKEMAKRRRGGKGKMESEGAEETQQKPKKAGGKKVSFA